MLTHVALSVVFFQDDCTDTIYVTVSLVVIVGLELHCLTVIRPVIFMYFMYRIISTVGNLHLSAVMIVLVHD